jgi:hypothetical protein
MQPTSIPRPGSATAGQRHGGKLEGRTGVWVPAVFCMLGLVPFCESRSDMSFIFLSALEYSQATCRGVQLASVPRFVLIPLCDNRNATASTCKCYGDTALR